MENIKAVFLILQQTPAFRSTYNKDLPFFPTEQELQGNHLLFQSTESF